MLRRNLRRQRVVNPFENAEGKIALSFSNLNLHSVTELEPSKLNGLPITRFIGVNPANGDTVTFLSQCAVRDLVKEAALRAEAGEKVVIKNVYGNRAGRQYATGMTTVFVKNMEFAPAAEKTVEVAPIVHQMERLQPLHEAIQ